jgi:2'-5' RNA ligase
MKGLVALLDPPATQRVLDLWDELERHFNLRGVLNFPFPHISFNILDTYETEQVEPELRLIAARLKPFMIQTAGLGMFLFPEPVLYIPVVRSPQLNLVHQRLWRAFPQKMGSMSLYSPDHWVPHITLAVDDLVREQMPEVLDHLKGKNFHWTIRLEGLTFAVKTDTGYEFPCGCKFGG